MQTMEKALMEVKDLHQKLLGRPAPEISDFYPFPPGIDPCELAAREVEYLQLVAKQIAGAPRPGTWVPKADCLVTDEVFVVRMEVPGISREDLKVFRVRNEIVVRGERKPPEQDLRPVSLEREWGPFERRFVLPAESSGELKARYQDGVLEVRIPVTEPATESKTVTIKVE